MLKQYDDVADEYEKLFEKFNESSIDDYFKKIPSDLSGFKLLDLGCGTGFDLAKFQSLGANTCGIDSSGKMVSIAKKRSPESYVSVACFEQLPFEDQTFDIVVSKWALQTAKSLHSVFVEVERVLKPGGRFIYLSCHPIRQFMEKKGSGQNYFHKEMVTSVFFDGLVKAFEPSHTFMEYFSEYFFQKFEIQSFEEGIDLSIERVNGSIYPGHFIVSSVKKCRGF